MEPTTNNEFSPSNQQQIDQYTKNSIVNSTSKLQSHQNTSSKISTFRSKVEPIEALSVGLLAEFSSLRELEVQLEQIVDNQKILIENIVNLNNFYTQNDELMEIQLMMKKMNIYRMKLKKVRSDMLYIRSTIQNLLQKAIELQNIKVNQKAEQVRKYDYEIGLIAKAKQ